MLKVKPQDAVGVDRALGAKVAQWCTGRVSPGRFDSDGGSVGDMTLEFIVRLREPPCSRLRLSRPFAGVMEVDQTLGLRLHMSGCRNDTMWVDVEYHAPHVILLWRGWKTLLVPKASRKGTFSASSWWRLICSPSRSSGAQGLA